MHVVIRRILQCLKLLIFKKFNEDTKTSKQNTAWRELYFLSRQVLAWAYYVTVFYTFVTSVTKTRWVCTRVRRETFSRVTKRAVALLTWEYMVSCLPYIHIIAKLSGEMSPIHVWSNWWWIVSHVCSQTARWACLCVYVSCFVCSDLMVCCLQNLCVWSDYMISCLISMCLVLL